MHRLISIIGLMFICTSIAYAQTWVSGSFNFDYRPPSVYSWGISPIYGRDENKHLSDGIQLGYTSYKTFTGKTRTRDITTYYASPFVRYVYRPRDFYYLYVQLAAGYQLGNALYVGDTQKSYIYYATLSGGLCFKINRHFYASAQFGYLTYSYTRVHDYRYHTRPSLYRQGELYSNTDLTSVRYGLVYYF